MDKPVATAIPARGQLSTQFLAQETMPRKIHPTLTLDGATAYFVDAIDNEVFVAAFDIARQEVAHYIHLRSPEEMKYPHTHVDEKSLWVVSDSGAVLQLALDSYRIMRWHPSEEFETPGTKQHGGLVPPRSTYLWLKHESEDKGETTEVTDLKTGKLIEILESIMVLNPILGTPVAKVFAYNGSDSTVFNADGTEHQQLAWVEEAVPLPKGDGGKWDEWVSISSPDSNSELELNLHDDFSQDRLYTREVPLSVGIRGHVLACSLKSGCIYVLFHTRSKALQLACFQAEEKYLRRLYNARVPFNSMLMQDIHGHAALLAIPTATGVRTLSLSDEEPTFNFGIEDSNELPRFRMNYFCGRTPVDQQIDQVAAEFSYVQSEQRRQETVAQFLAEHADNPQSSLVFADQIRRRGKMHEADQLTALVSQRHPDQPLLGIYLAEGALRACVWLEALKHLSRVPEQKLPAHQKCHLHHLRGLALFYEGRTMEAREEFERALSFEGDPCGVRPFHTAATALLEGISSGVEPDIVGEFYARLRRADVLLGAGEAEKAWELLDDWSIWRIEDSQLLARVATAAVLHPARDLAFEFRRRYACAQYLSSLESIITRLLVLSAIHWPPDQLDAVAKSAKECLSKPLRHRPPRTRLADPPAAG